MTPGGHLAEDADDGGLGVSADEGHQTVLDHADLRSVLALGEGQDRGSKDSDQDQEGLRNLWQRANTNLKDAGLDADADHSREKTTFKWSTVQDDCLGHPAL